MNQTQLNSFLLNTGAAPITQVPDAATDEAPFERVALDAATEGQLCQVLGRGEYKERQMAESRRGFVRYLIETGRITCSAA